MCCIFTALVLLGPRAGIFFWWLLDPARWALAFAGTSFVIPLVGFLFFPLTTLMWVAVFPGGVDGFDIVWLGLAVILDLGSSFGGAYGNRNRLSTAA
jgi:hypothetical protein